MKKVILSAAMIAIGTFAMAQQNKMTRNMDPAQMEQKRAEKLQSMKSELNLSDAQVTKIKSLQDAKISQKKANEPQMQAERKMKMEEMKKQREQWKSQMKQILTPEQYAKWEQKQADKMKMKGDKMKQTGKKMMVQPAR